MDQVNTNITVTQKKIQNEDSVLPCILCTRDIKKIVGKSCTHISYNVSLPELRDPLVTVLYCRYTLIIVVRI